MKRIFQVIFCIIVSLLTGTKLLHSARVISGNSNKKKQTFDFPTGPSARFSSCFFTGAKKKKDENNFAVAANCNNHYMDSFLPLAPKEVKLDGKKQKNPLLGSAIKILKVIPGGSVISGKPIVVTKEDPSKMYVFTNFFFEDEEYKKPIVEMKSVELVGDDGKKVEILDLTLGKGMIYVLVKPKGGHFGDPGSGVTVVNAIPVKQYEEVRFAGDKSTEDKEDKNEKEKSEKSKKRIVPINSQTKGLNFLDSSDEKNNLQFIEEKPSINFFAHNSSEFLYIGVQVKSESSGSCGLLMLEVGRAGKIDFVNPIDLDRIGKDSIIATNGINKPVSIYGMDYMYTSSSKDYIIIMGGVSVDLKENVKNVYALPFPLGERDKKSKETEKPISAQDPAVTVGGGELPGKSMGGMQVSSDAIFVSVKKANKNSDGPGIYHSQAIFDQVGNIVRWTKWKRVGGTDAAKKLSGFAYDENNAAFWFASTKKDSSKVYKNNWDSFFEKYTPLSKLPDKVFEEPSLISAIQSFPRSTNNNAIESPLLFISSDDEVLVVETARPNESGILSPTKKFEKIFTAKNEKLENYPKDADFQVIKFETDENYVGVICGFAILNDGSNGWIALAGNRGVLVLSDESGKGWNGSLQPGFKNLHSGLQLRKIRTYPYDTNYLDNVIKLFGWNKRLFMMVRGTLEMIDLKDFDGSPQSLKPKVIFRESFEDYLHDFLINGKTSLISTRKSLLKTTQDLMNISSVSEVKWENAIQEAYSFHNEEIYGIIDRYFFRFNSENNPQSEKTDNLYLVQENIFKSKTLVRKIILDLEKADISFLRDEKYIWDLDLYYKFLASDGSKVFFADWFGPDLYLSDHNAYPYFDAEVNKYFPFCDETENYSLENLPPYVESIIWDHGSGTWIVFGDFGIRLLG